MALSSRGLALRIREKGRSAGEAPFTPDRQTLISMIQMELAASGIHLTADEIVSTRDGIEVHAPEEVSPQTIDQALRKVLNEFVEKTQIHAATNAVKMKQKDPRDRPR